MYSKGPLSSKTSTISSIFDDFLGFRAHLQVFECFCKFSSHDFTVPQISAAQITRPRVRMRDCGRVRECGRNSARNTISFPEHARSQVKGGHSSGEIELIQACDWLTADNTLDFQREFYINKVFGISRRKFDTFYTEID